MNVSDVPFDINVDELPPIDLEAPPIEEAPPTPKKKSKLKGIHEQTVDLMLGMPNIWPAFHQKFHKIMDSQGVCQYLAEDERSVVRPINTALIDYEIRRYWDEILPRAGFTLPILAADDTIKTRKLWEQRSKPLEEKPLPIAWKSQKGLAYERLDFNPALPKDFDPDRDMPYFAELLSRLENWCAVAAWIGSLFDPLSQRQQYVWIYGKGGEGKGSLARVLCRIFGSSAASEQPPGPHDRFWTSGLIGKRLVVFPDMTSPDFVTWGVFKSLTGEDPTRIERKGKDVFTAHLDAKYIILSNDQPRVSLASADMRRIIYSPIRQIEKMLPDYEETLEKETPFFISYCWKLYREMTGGNPRKMIESDVVWAREAADDASEIYQAVFSRFWVFSDDPNARVTTADITERLNSMRLGNYFDKNFKKWLCDQPGCQRVRKADGLNRTIYYTGVCPRHLPITTD